MSTETFIGGTREGIWPERGDWGDGWIDGNPGFAWPPGYTQI